MAYTFKPGDLNWLQAMPSPPDPWRPSGNVDSPGLSQGDYNYEGKMAQYQRDLAAWKQQAGPERWDYAVQQGYISADGTPTGKQLPDSERRAPEGYRYRLASETNGQTAVGSHGYVGNVVQGKGYDDSILGRMELVEDKEAPKETFWEKWAPLIAPVSILAGGVGIEALAAGAGAAAGGGVSGSIYGGLGSAGGGFGTEIAGAGAAGAGAAAGGGGASVAGSAGGFSGLGEAGMGTLGQAGAVGGGTTASVAGSAGGFGSSVVKYVAEALGVTPAQAAKIVSGLGAAGIGALGEKIGGGGGGGGGGGSQTNQDNYWNNVNMTHPNQTNAQGDTSKWSMDPSGKWSETSAYSPAKQAVYDTQLNTMGKNATIANSMDMSGYADPMKQFKTVGDANPYKTTAPSMGGFQMLDPFTRKPYGQGG